MKEKTKGWRSRLNPPHKAAAEHGSRCRFVRTEEGLCSEGGSGAVQGLEKGGDCKVVTKVCLAETGG